MFLSVSRVTADDGDALDQAVLLPLNVSITEIVNDLDPEDERTDWEVVDMHEDDTWRRHASLNPDATAATVAAPLADPMDQLGVLATVLSPDPMRGPAWG